MKTIKKWLEELPEGYKELALANAKENVLNNKKDDMCDAISSSFIWSNSSQGRDFWENVYFHFSNESELPNLPIK